MHTHIKKVILCNFVAATTPCSYIIEIRTIYSRRSRSVVNDDAAVVVPDP